MKNLSLIASALAMLGLTACEKGLVDGVADVAPAGQAANSVLQSKRVKIDGLGIFFTTLENTEGGAESKDKFLPQKNLKGLHRRFSLM